MIERLKKAAIIALALVCVYGAVGFAQTSATSSSQQAGTTPPAQTKLTASDQVTVTAEGETRDVQTVDSKLLLETTPGTSPIAVLGHLPSVSITSADPYGAYEWAVRISIRGFNQNQLGFTLDDVPLGDMSYGNLNGLHISRGLIDENLGHAALSQGTGSLDTASTSNLGGAVQFFSADPTDRRGFQATQSFGSFSGSRTFARYDSGLLHTHTKLFVDGVYQTSDKWRGAGPIRQSYFQFNTKLQQMIGSKGVFTAYMDYSNRQEVDYQDENKLWVQKFGYHTDNFGDWGTALQAANAYNAQGGGGKVFAGIPTVFPGAIPTIQSKFGDLSNDPEDVGYYAAGGLRKDFLGYLKYETAITDHLRLKTTVYGHHNNGAGLWYTPYLATYDTTGTAVSPISERTSEYRIARGGVLAEVNYENGRNSAQAGVWFEKESFDLARRFYGTTLQNPTFTIYDVPKNPFFTQWAYNFPTNLFQIYAQDKFKLTSKLTVAAGFKVSETYTNGILTGFDQGIPLNPTDKASNYAQGKLTSGKPFLPQVGVNFKLNDKSEVFADVAENVRAFQAGGNGFGTSPWGTTQAGFNALTNNLKSESAWSEEGGYRYTSNRIQAQASYFHVNFYNRLLAIQQGPGIAGAASLLSNVGGVTTNGDHNTSARRMDVLQRPHL
jgi:iron complex outermembrane receptor protein